MARTYDWRWTIAAPPERVWPYLRDTERINKAAGLQVVQFTDEPLPEGGACRMGRFDFLGMRIEWEEKPYEWVAGRWMTVERVYRAGPMSRMLVRIDLEPLGSDATTVRVQLTVTPRNVLLVPVFHGQMVGMVRPGFDRAYRHLDAYLQGRVKYAFPDDPPRLQPDHAVRADAARIALRQAGVPDDLAQAVVRRVLELPDRDVARIRAHEWAEALGASRPLTLRALLVAADAGLLELLWDVNCPHCRGGPRNRKLGDVQTLNACLSCNVEFAVRFDREVEVTFAPHPDVRRLDLSEHCVGGPGKTPHVALQRRIPPGQTVEVPVELSPEVWRLRSPYSSASAELTVHAEGQTDATVTIRPDGIAVTGRAVAGQGALKVTNTTEFEQLLSVDDPAFGRSAVTGAQVSALQAFRDRFVGEVMAADQQLPVAWMTFLFTDLRASTAMYEAMGDGEALTRVRQHFSVLFAVVEQHNGAIVKTVGDAVMAVFDSPADALRAALQAVPRVGALRLPSGEPLTLRVGVHGGACLAVNLDNRLDYFGSTVNRAARVEHESRGDDVVLGAELLDHPEVARILSELPAVRFQAQLRGVPEPVTLLRVTPQS